MRLTLSFSGTPEPGTPTVVNPASSLLQDLLKEQRANRSSRGTAPDGWEDNAPRTPEGPRLQEDTASEKARKVSDAFSNGQRQPIGMGMREMDQVRLQTTVIRGVSLMSTVRFENEQAQLRLKAGNIPSHTTSGHVGKEGSTDARDGRRA